MKCWDRALAQSFNACTQMRCPTCRSPVRVDFDPATGHATFTAQDGEVDPDETRQRIAEQMRPAQVRMLQRFGREWPLEGDGSLEGVLSALTARLQEQLKPNCVCGSTLRRVSLAYRAELF